MTYDTQAPYIASYLIIRNDENKIAFVLRKNTSWMNDHYGLPAGKVEKGETYTKAAIREAKEELGIDVRPQDLQHALTVHRYSNDDTNTDMAWVDSFFVCTGYTGTVHNAEPDMHSEVAWFSDDELPDKVTPPVREAIEAIKQGKTYIEHGWN